MSKIVDIHCHHLSDDPAVEEIYVADSESIVLSPPLTHQALCVGLHPWKVESIDYDKFKPTLMHYLSHPQFFALGEIGLDKVSSVNYDLQKKVFIQQLELAKKLQLKRIIIHSVKAHSDIIEQLKRVQYPGKILIHDFYSNIETAKQYLKFDCYFSFGKKLFKNQNAQNVLSELPIEKVFFETDDQLDYNIFEIYKQASGILGVDIEKLRNSIFQNFLDFSSS